MADTPPRPLLIRAVIPHYFREGANPVYGSGREGVRLERSVALLRCLHGLLGLRHLPQDLQLNLIEAAGEVLPPQDLEGAPLPMEIEIHHGAAAAHGLQEAPAQHKGIGEIHMGPGGLQDRQELLIGHLAGEVHAAGRRIPGS
jgi:hypothetical protein